MSRTGRTLVVGQSGGGTPVINASLAGIVEAARASERFDAIAGLGHGVEGLLAGKWIELGGLSAGDLDRLAATPSAALGSCRRNLAGDEVERALAALVDLGAAAFCYIGGDDSARTTAAIAEAARASGRPIACLAVPKTIDNDLPVTDHTPGFGSAARCLTAIVRDIDADARAMRTLEPVRLIETKGRDSGWLTLAAALARRHPDDAPHLFYVPEQPFEAETFLADVERVVSRRGYCVAVIAETVRDPVGQLVGAGGNDFVDAFGHRYTDGPAAYLVRLTRQRLGLRARYDRPGTLLKTGVGHVSPVDRAEARAVGRAAVAAAIDRAPDAPPVLIGLERQPGPEYRCTTAPVDLTQIIGRVKTLPDAWLPVERSAVDPAFLDYLRPLIGDLPAGDYFQFD